MMKERKPNRLKGYDYSSDNLYFVTSCVHNRICCFGEIVVRTGRDLSLQPHSHIMILNEWGTIAEKQWYWLQEQYPYVVLHAFVVMPNHIHGIIEINRKIVGTGRDPSLQNNDKISVVGTGRDPSLRPKIKSLSELMGAYKTTVSKQIHLLERSARSHYGDRSRPVPRFEWQRSFYEHIIRDEKSFKKISDYILNNPINWEQDNLHFL